MLAIRHFPGNPDFNLEDNLKSFQEFEKEFARTPVRLIDFGSASGVLALRGPQSSLHVASEKFFAPPHGDDNGWYDIESSGIPAMASPSSYSTPRTILTHALNELELL